MSPQSTEVHVDRENSGLSVLTAMRCMNEISSGGGGGVSQDTLCDQGILRLGRKEGSGVSEGPSHSSPGHAPPQRGQLPEHTVISQTS